MIDPTENQKALDKLNWFSKNP